tara:strand:+ start:5950 stop:6201 length:252 start_codon:yes stop_codon:yes gene_type:complete
MGKARIIPILKGCGHFAGGVYAIVALVVMFVIMLDFMGVKESFNLPDTFTMEERRIALAAVSPGLFYLIFFAMTLRNDSHGSK